jgi:hypothetical protein
VIASTVFRLLKVAVAFLVAVAVALVVLYVLGIMWVADELRAAVPHDPVLEHGAAAFGAVLFAIAVTPALTILPALVAVVVGEVLRLRSWMYYVLAGGAALAAIPLLADFPEGAADVATSAYMPIFLAAGFAGGFVYWLLAGARA